MYYAAPVGKAQDERGLRARLTMSHEFGKVEELAVTDDIIVCRYHRPRNPAAGSAGRIRPEHNE